MTQNSLYNKAKRIQPLSLWSFCPCLLSFQSWLCYLQQK